MKHSIVIGLVILLFVGCNNHPANQFKIKNNNQTLAIQWPDTLPTYNQITNILNESGCYFRPDFFYDIPTQNRSIEINALQAGIIMADIIYFYNQKKVTLTKKQLLHLEKKLQRARINSKDLKETMYQLETHIQSSDTAITILSNTFSDFTKNLHESQQSALAALITSGFWIESTRIATGLTNFNSTKNSHTWHQHTHYGDVIIGMLETIDLPNSQLIYKQHKNLTSWQDYKKHVDSWYKNIFKN